MDVFKNFLISFQNPIHPKYGWLVNNFVGNLKDYSWKNCGRSIIKEIEYYVNDCWIHLNIGHWSEIDGKWRFTYVFFVVLKIFLNKFLFFENDMTESLELIDKCLLFTGNLMKKELNELFEELKRDEYPSEIIDIHLNELIEDDRDVIKIKFPIEERNELSLFEFREEYLMKDRPVIIKNFVHNWPATTKWSSTKYLLEKCSNRTVPVEVDGRYSDAEWSQQLMQFEDFLHKLLSYSSDKTKSIELTTKREYLAQHQLFEQISDLRNDIYIPDYCLLQKNDIMNDDEATDDVEECVTINSWFGPRGTVSSLHRDPKSNLFCQVIGYKYIRLYNNEDTPRLYCHSDSLLKNTSQVDVENINKEKFPLAVDCPYTECVLPPGSVLFIPASMWHYVRSLSISFSVNFWWE
ncbi:hypothetical protein SNEBB_004191 [Seison nebaliae]|nr:hypothetical protein SNEBB_004191 [Seison nebaliae]